jgi:hypothetical protein
VICLAFLNIDTINVAYKRLAKLQLPLYTYLRLRGKQTNCGGSGWSIEGRKNMMNCLWQSRLTESKTPSSLIHSSFFFQARRRRKQLAKHNAKDDARPKAKAVYHCMNELEDNSDEGDSVNEKLSCPTVTVTLTTTMCIVL